MKWVLVGAATTGLVIGCVGPAQADVQCRMKHEKLTEISGISSSTRHQDVIWAHNDSGGGPYIYALNTKDCRIQATVTIRNVDARDFEAIGVGAGSIWLADIGDNRNSWPYVEMVSFPEPGTLTNRTVDASTYRITYPQGPLDAEALLVKPDSGRLWVATKQLIRGGLYRLPKRLSETSLNRTKRVGRVGGLVTDGSYAPSGDRYVLRDYWDAVIYQGRPPGTEVARIALPSQIQGEAITWTADGKALLIASERDRAVIRVPVPTSRETATDETVIVETTQSQTEAVSQTSGHVRWLLGLSATGIGLLGALLAWRAWRKSPDEEEHQSEQHRSQ